MQTTIVTLAGKEYQLRPLSIRRSREVRNKMIGPLGAAVRTIREIPGTNLSDFAAISGLLESIQYILADSLDLCLGVIYDFSPEIAQDREAIEDKACDEEALMVFLEVVKMLYPFGNLIKSLNGLTQRETSTRSV